MHHHPSNACGFLPYRQGEYEINKLVEICGCIEIPSDIATDFVIDKFIKFVEKNGWTFGGGFQTIIDDWYVDEKGENQTY